MSRKTCTLLSRQRCPRQECAPSFGAASMVRARRRCAGRHCAPRCWRGSGLLGGRQGPALFFYHAALGVRCVVHGDDFTFTGYDADLDVVEKLVEEKLVCKVEGRLGRGPQDLREGKLLNRISRWAPTGLRYEADPRRAE
eukprot:1256879-Alexandrium_andersonii.AAC.2